jgi:hypothetical protein
LTEQSSDQDAYLSDFSTDEDGHIKVFKRLAEQDSDDELHPKFLNKRKGKKVTMLLACLKSKMFKIEENSTKITYIKKQFVEQCIINKKLRTETE